MPTPASLRAQWRLRTEPEDVLGFYSQRHEYGFCSNFFISQPPFEFKLSPMLQRTVPLTPSNGFVSVVLCDCAEKAIMLCKAALMGDGASYQKIVQSSTPAEAKRLGRNVRPFDHARWDSAVCQVATEVLWMKFAPDPALRRALLDTGDRVLAEATRYDQIWGIGLDKGEEAMRTPAKWRGANILGWALMEVRTKLRAQTVSTPRPLDRAAARSTVGAAAPIQHQSSPLREGDGTFLDDNALLAVDLEGLVAAASPKTQMQGQSGLTPDPDAKREANPANAQPQTSQCSVHREGDGTFLDDNALLAVDLEGLVAAASPKTQMQGQSGLTPDPDAKREANPANAQPRTMLRKGTARHHARSRANSSDDDELDPDDPDGSVAALFAAERSPRAAAAGAERVQKRRRRVETLGDEDL